MASIGCWIARYFESTDDAYVAGNVVAITSRENATVLALHADNTQTVQQGQLLIEMDPAVANVNLQAAEANLARVVRTRARRNSPAPIPMRAQLTQAQVALAQAQGDYQRRQRRFATGAVSGEELAHARDAVAAAQAAVQFRAQGGLAQARASIDGADIAHNPDVLAAEAQLRAAAIALAICSIVAPVDGVIAQRTVQVGQQVAAGTPLMAVVPLSNVWIDANFKEVQLPRMRIGQPVTVTTDIYGGERHLSRPYRGPGRGLAAAPSRCCRRRMPPATGSRSCSACRCASRSIPQELRDHPLRVGLSVARRRRCPRPVRRRWSPPRSAPAPSAPIPARTAAPSPTP